MKPVVEARTFMALFVVGLLALLGAGCAGQPQEPDQIRMQFSWEHTIEFAGFYAAEADGYYADENLKVELATGGFDAEGNFINPVEQVISGEADFGDANAVEILKARAEGQPVVAIATIYQRHPLAFTSLAEKGLITPEDLGDATIDISGNSMLLFEAMLAERGLDGSDFNLVPRSDFTINSLISGETDVIDAFVTNEVVELKLEGYEVNTILPAEYGIEVYPNAIFTTEDMIANNPDLVERFLRATINGMDAAINDPERAAELALTYNDALSLEKETEAMFQSLPLINPADSQPGMMQLGAWEATQDIMLAQDLLEEPLDLEAAYTVEFVDKIYGE